MQVDLLRVKAERIAKNMKQQEVAEKLGMTRVQYAKRENGFVSFSADELINTALALGYGKDEVGLFFKPTVSDMQH